LSVQLVGSVTPQTVTIPTSGKKLDVRLRCEVNCAWTATGNTFSEAGSPAPPALTAP
jgi:hypothetical protein